MSELSATHDLAPFARDARDKPRDAWRWGVGVTLVLLGAYVLLFNPYWVPGGDSDFYVAIARTLALEGKYQYNGLPVAISPPGWPWVMALVLQVSPTFAAMKVVTLLTMLGSLVIGYLIALRFVRPRTAAVAIGLTGLLMPVYSLTYFLHSEGLYCLFSAWALLIAFRVRERRAGYAEKAILLALCVGLPLVRWAGVFQLLPILGVLLSGAKFSGIKRGAVLSILCTVTLVATWLGTRWSLELTADQIAAIKASGGSSVMDTDVTEDIGSDATSVTVLPINAKGTQTVYEEYGQRFVRSGKWFAWLLWQPTRFAGVNKWLDSGVTLLGWSVIVMLGTVAVITLRRGEYLWLALALYCGGLCMNWPNPNSRYLVPVAPQLMVGLFVFFNVMSAWFPAISFDGWKWLRRALVYSVLLCNLFLYGSDVLVMRSGRAFYNTFEAGQHKDLVAAASYLMSLPVYTAPTTQPGATPSTPPSTQLLTQPTPTSEKYRPGNGRVMINERYENLGRTRFSKAGMRAMVLLTGVYIKPLDEGLARNTTPPFSRRVSRFVRQRSCHWLLVQAPSIPWRLWHFRLPMSWHERLTKNPGQPPSGGWTLYWYNPATGELEPVPVPNVQGWPTRVPGM